MWFSGGVDVALVALSFKPAHYLDIPLDWYPALEQQVLILGPAGASAAAREFVEFLLAPPVQQLIAESGYRPGVPLDG
jgi:ABC-type Fe3+ transport system substrate-binding protein